MVDFSEFIIKNFDKMILLNIFLVIFNILFMLFFCYFTIGCKVVKCVKYDKSLLLFI